MTKKSYSIGVDFGGTNIKFGIVSTQGKLIEFNSVKTSAEKGKNHILNIIINEINKIIKKARLPKSSVFGIGIGAPGPLDHEKGIIHFAPNLPDWENVPIVDLLNKKLHLPVYLENDANAIAIGEGWIGAARDMKNFVLYALGTGIGGGIVINGKIFRGFMNFAGEIGHTKISPGGELCGCGNRGCLEAYISSSSIKKNFIDAVKWEKGLTWKFDKPITVKYIFELAENGDIIAVRIMEKFAHYLGISISNIINLLNPEGIILSGGLAESLHLYKPILELEIRKNTLSILSERDWVRKGQLGLTAGVIGASKCVLRK